MNASEFVEPIGDGVFTIDTGFHRPRYDAAYLVVERGRAAFIDTGTNFAVPRLLAALTHVGLGPSDVDWVIPTHVHLDHAGGAGQLMQRLPQARMAIHRYGAPHMKDPSALQAGSTAIYGEAEMARSYGTLVPVEASRIMVADDGAVIELAGRPLECIDTPGHARHHLCVWDTRARLWFTGDTFGQSYAEISNTNGRFIVPSSTPVQFEPESLKRSIDRLLERDAAGVCLTHYGRVDEVRRMGRELIEQIDEMAALGRLHASAPDRAARLREGLTAMCRRRLMQHGFAQATDSHLARMALDIRLNADGIVCWLDREQRKRRT